MSWFLLFVGLGVLVLGAELLVRGASALATRFGISSLVIGLTIVAFGTSSPEIAVSLSAVARGQPDLSLGNAVGSNTFNTLVILGIAAIIRPLTVDRKLLRIEVPLIVLIGGALWIMLADGLLGLFDGVVLFSGIIVYTAAAIWSARGPSGKTPAVLREKHEKSPDMPGGRSVPRPSMVGASLFVAAGLGLSILGARWLVAGAVSIAQSLGISELVIGLTIVAAGTSLPELATSVVASVRGQRDIAVGNVLGSNIFNILAILGLTGMLARGGVAVPPSLLSFDLLVMLAVSVACLPVMLTGCRIDRWEGFLFLAAYAGYSGSLAVSSARPEGAGLLGAIMPWPVFLLAGLGIAIPAARAILERGRSKANIHRGVSGPGQQEAP